MSDQITAAACWDDERQQLRLVDPVMTNAVVRKKFKPGAGEEFTVILMRPEDAARWGQYKYLFGYVFEPVVLETGHTETELLAMAKVKFMPEGKKSLTELGQEGLKKFTDETERWLRTDCPEAFQKHGREYVA